MMSASIRVPVTEPTHPAEARRIAAKMATEIGFNEVRAAEVSIVVTEAGTNILKHAGGGEILLRFADSGDEGATELEMLALDRGPGMSNLDRCLQDGYTTASSPGGGLGAIQRLSDESDFYSVADSGTAVLARWHSKPALSHPEPHVRRASQLRVGAINVSKYGQEVCGDSWGIERQDGYWTVLVADGLGHGYEASQASREAVRMLHAHPGMPPKSLVELSHGALRSMRGAAVAVVRVDESGADRGGGILTFCGVGNIAAQIYNGSRHAQHLVSVNGTAGQMAPRLREFTFPWPEGGMLLLHSDGLATSTGLDTQPGLALRDPSLIAGVLYRDFSRGHDDATIIVAKAA